MTLSASCGKAAPVFLDASSVILERRPTLESFPSLSVCAAVNGQAEGGRVGPQSRPMSLKAALTTVTFVPLCSSARRFSKPEIASIKVAARA